MNNAGIQDVSPFEKFSIARLKKVLETNLNSAIYCAHAVFDRMKELGDGVILNIGSVHSVVASHNKLPYVTSKHAMVGFTKSLALEGAPHNVRANMISPGFVWTPLVEEQARKIMQLNNVSMEQAQKTLLAKHPNQQFVKLDEVSNMAMFLSTPQNKSITGANFCIDGGWSII